MFIRKEKIQEVINHHGEKLVPILLSELGISGVVAILGGLEPDNLKRGLTAEVGELLQVVSKIERKGLDSSRRMNLIEEIRDVRICLDILMSHYKISHDEIDHAIFEKLRTSEEDFFDVLDF